MQKLGRIVAAVVVLLAGADLAAQRQGRAMGGVGITVYEDRDFRGRNATFRDDVPDLRQAGMNDRIESLEVAPGEMWEVCVDVYYRGRCQVFSAYESDLRQRGWAREISSMRRVRGGGGGYYPPPVYPPVYPGPPAIGGGLRLYDKRNFEGSSRTLQGPTPDLRALGFNDKAESLQLPRGDVWEICRDIDYVGCLQVNSDWPDLRRHGGLSGEISSARPWRSGGGWNPGPRPPYPGDGYGGQIVLYSGVNYTGRSYSVAGVSDAIAMQQVRSVRVDGGNWQLCEDTGFRGRCTAVNVNVPDLRSLGLPGRVRSVRPVASPR